MCSNLLPQTIAVRLNRRDGTASSILLDKGKAIRHTNQANDIALIPIMPDVTVFDMLALPIAREEVVKQRSEIWDVALGDEVCAVGLYTSHHGRTKNVPVVRIGNLSALCDEPVDTLKGAVDAYLVEMRTIAGLSGSPVFIVVPPVGSRDGQVAVFNGFNVVPLGILVGYHVVASKEDQVPVPRFRESNAPQNEQDEYYSPDERNTGFGIVIPIERVMEILERKDLQAEMRLAVDAWGRGTGFRNA